jgi:CRISPR/Cas system-associated exonuclease Cas4 (RecB family)
MERAAMNLPSETPSRVITCRGARATERRLLDEVDRLVASSFEDLSAPVRIVVPSRSLRRHLLRLLARRRGAVVGIQVQTLFGLALEAVSRSGRLVPGADAAFALQVRRLAAAEPTLCDSLDDLADGYDSVVGAVRDLLDAGFLPGNEDGVIEKLDDVAAEVAPERVERSRALVRLAAAAFAEAEELGLERSTRSLQIAEEALGVHGPDLLPTKALIVHGFADVTGVAADLLLILVRVLSGTVLLDRPPDPAAPDRDDLGGAYLSRLEERMAHLDQETDEGSDPPPDVELAEAPDAEAEARWVAERIRGLLDRGVEPEEIGVVGRGLEAMALPLRRHFRRLGVPFSGEGAMVPGAGPGRRLRRLTEVLRRGPASEIDRWAETRAEHENATELLLGLRVLGVQRLADLAELGADAAPPAGVLLPMAVGAEDEVEDDPGSSRRLPNDVLRRAVDEAQRLVSVLDGWPAIGIATVHRRHTAEVLAALGWDEQATEARAVRNGLDALCREFPPAFDLARGEWLKLVGDRLEHAGDVSLGGEGAGVQVLTVMESRARTFGHLLVAGVNRGVFPRIGHEDSMLPEAVRARLAADVLPEMPVKGRSADEERYLFAQLLSSAPTVTLSWHVYGGDGTMTPSPFVDRLQLRAGVEAPTSVQQLWPSDDTVTKPRTAYELAVLAAPSAGARRVGGLLAAAVAEGRADADEESAVVPPEDVAAARTDLMAVVERPANAAGVSPWFGVSGAGEDSDDATLWVTHAENTGTCPWRAFVTRRLGVMPLPDPLLGLPGIDGPLVGQVVHGVLEAIVSETVANRGELEEVLARAPVEIRWPDRDRLDELVVNQARRVATQEGLEPLGMAPLLAARARQFLEVERGLEWESGLLGGVLGTEVEGSTTVPGVARTLFFRADRVDSDGETIVLVDYKAAKPMSTAGKPTRIDHLQKKIARGRLLQAAAYSQTSAIENARGEYLYLKPNEDWTDEMREVVIESDNDALVEVFSTAIETIVTARAEGVVFPRVEEADGKTAEHCSYCAVAEACRREDSAFRRDLVRWMNDVEDSGDAAVDAARSLWWLGFDRPESDG